MGAGGAAGKHRRGRRFDGDKFNRRLFRLEVFSRAGDGAARADSGYYHVNSAAGVFPDFRAGGFFVDDRICRIFKLLEDE